MDGYSWSNRKQQGALFCQFCPQVGKPRGHQPLFGSDSAVRRSVLSSTVLVIGKAYDELFKQRSPAVLILTGFFHDFAWQSTQYFTPLYYQTVRGFSPLKSATLIVPFLLAQGIAGAASGPLMAKYAR